MIHVPSIRQFDYYEITFFICSHRPFTFINNFSIFIHFIFIFNTVLMNGMNIQNSITLSSFKYFSLSGSNFNKTIFGCLPLCFDYHYEFHSYLFFKIENTIYFYALLSHFVKILLVNT